jgi:type IV pilus assembly protein PilW
MPRTTPRRDPNRQLGFTLVEIMVGMLIGLIGIIVIFQVFQVSESRKRTTTAGSDAQIAGSVAMFSLERDLRLGGFGFGAAASASGGSLMGCNVNVYDNANPAANFILRLAPVVITDGVAGAPDSITVLWGSSLTFSNFETFTTTTDTSKLLKFRNGIDRGDLAVVGGALTTAPQGCHLIQVTDNTNADQRTINHAAGGYTSKDGTTPLVTRYNNPAGPGMTFAGTNDYLFNLGPYPRANKWSVRNGKLTLEDLLHYVDLNPADGQNDWIEVADGVLDLQAQYGYDANLDGQIADNEWTVVTPPTNADWAKVRAVRVAILARSGEYEKGYTAANPVWGCGNGISCTNFVMTNLDGSAGSTVPTDPTVDWRHYRYRIYETVIPFRNVIWGAS